MFESDELAKLGELHQRGILSDDEFIRAKERVLGSASAASYAVPPPDALDSLRRSRHDRWFGGVCGGIGYTTGIPSWIWRLLFTVLVLCCGTGLLAYVLLWIFIPAEMVRGPSRQPGY